MDLTRFSKARIVVIGDLMLDRYWWGSVTRISPEAPVPIVRLERTTTTPGGAANVAVNAAALGADVKLIGCAGNDVEASELVEALAEKNVDPGAVIECEGRRTIVKTRVLAHGQQVVRLDREDVVDLSGKESARILDNVSAIINECDLAILSDYGKGTLSDDVVRSIIQLFKATDRPILADPKGKHFEKYSGVSVLTPNRREAAEACKLDESLPDLVKVAGNRLLKEIDLQNVLITEGENGMTLFEKNSAPLHLDAVAHEVFDVTGAGDSVIACLGVAIASGFGVRDAAMLSNIAGGLSVQQIGTAAVSFASLSEAVQRVPALGSAVP